MTFAKQVHLVCSLVYTKPRCCGQIIYYYTLKWKTTIRQKSLSHTPSSGSEVSLSPIHMGCLEYPLSHPCPCSYFSYFLRWSSRLFCSDFPLQSCGHGQGRHTHGPRNNNDLKPAHWRALVNRYLWLIYKVEAEKEWRKYQWRSKAGLTHVFQESLW